MKLFIAIGLTGLVLIGSMLRTNVTRSIELSELREVGNGRYEISGQITGEPEGEGGIIFSDGERSLILYGSVQNDISSDSLARANGFGTAEVMKVGETYTLTDFQVAVVAADSGQVSGVRTEQNGSVSIQANGAWVRINSGGVFR